eukprot:UN3286
MRRVPKKVHQLIPEQVVVWEGVQGVREEAAGPRSRRRVVLPDGGASRLQVGMYAQEELVEPALLIMHDARMPVVRHVDPLCPGLQAERLLVDLIAEEPLGVKVAKLQDKRWHWMTRTTALGTILLCRREDDVTGGLSDSQGP